MKPQDGPVTVNVSATDVCSGAGTGCAIVSFPHYHSTTQVMATRPPIGDHISEPCSARRARAAVRRIYTITGRVR